MAIIGELVNNYISKVISIFNTLTESISVEERQMIKDLHNAVVARWNECFQGKIPIERFQESLDSWGVSQIEIVKLAFRPKSKAAKPRKPRERKLTAQQRWFIEHYLINQVGASAARDAGYSHRSARQTAYELLQNPLIKEEIDRRLTEQRVKRQAEIIERRRIRDEAAYRLEVRGLK
jgi:hypothetical protein